VSAVRMVLAVLALVALMFTVYTQSPILGILTGLPMGGASLWPRQQGAKHG
jgi:hypothetical protein